MDSHAHAIARLAGHDYIIKQVPMARVKRLGPVLAHLVQDLTVEDVQDPNALGTLLPKLLDAPHAVLSLFIEDLPRDIFQDEEHGVTMPELLDALKKAVDLNRLDALKNLWAGLGGGTLIQAGLAQMAKR